MRSPRRRLIQSRKTLLGALVFVLLTGTTLAQFGGGRFGGNWGGEFLRGDEPIQPLPADRSGVPNWELDPRFKNDAFTFVRLRFTNGHRGRFGGGGARGFGTGTATSWLNDWPSGDLNFSFRLQQLTSMKVNPDPVQLEIDDERLPDFPFVTLHQVGALEFTEEQVRILRRYLLNGGFLMVDDFWGTDQQNLDEQMKRLFPNRESAELSPGHPIFHCVFDLKKPPQIPTLQLWLRNAAAGDPERTWRSADDPGPHFRAICDDKERIMVLECANNDIADSWEREGDDEEYFHRFSEKYGYPLGINIIFYAMTH